MTGYYAGFSTYELPMSVVLTGTGAGTATIPDGYLSHIALGDGGVTGNASYDDFGVAFEAVLDALSAGFTVTFSQVTQAYTISRVSGTFALDFTSAGEGGTNLARALGFAGDRTAALSHTSDVRPYYLIEQDTSARSSWTNVYEPDEITQEAVADGGTAYGISKETTELYCDWVQQLESKEATIAHVATSEVPWTWQHFFRHCRATHPFTVVDAISAIEGGRVYHLRAEGAQATKDAIQLRYDDVESYWNIGFATRDYGFLP